MKNYNETYLFPKGVFKGVENTNRSLLESILDGHGSCGLVTWYTASTKVRTRTFELKKGDVMDPCLEDLGSRYLGTWYARMQTYRSYGCVRACIDTDRVQ